VIVLLILGCTLMGQALEDTLNPRLKVAHLGAKTFRLRPLVGRGSEAL
jgi:peptide/nickel transport system permease protein